jgi:hypothetical protein
MKGFDKKLKVAVKNLPMLEPKTDVWEVISKRLDFDQKLSSAVKELPLYNPGEELWTIIEKQLPRKIQVHKTRNFVIGISVAASIAFTFGIWFFMHKSNRETVTVSEEIINDIKLPEAAGKDSSSRQAFQFIDEQCKRNSYVCSKEGFSEKRLQLDEVESQLKSVDQVIHASGSSESLIKTRIKLENIKARLMKDILTIIES